MRPSENGAKIHFVVLQGPIKTCVWVQKTQQGAPIPLCHSSIIQPASKGLPHGERQGEERMKTRRLGVWVSHEGEVKKQSTMRGEEQQVSSREASIKKKKKERKKEKKPWNNCLSLRSGASQMFAAHDSQKFYPKLKAAVFIILSSLLSACWGGPKTTLWINNV